MVDGQKIEGARKTCRGRQKSGSKEEPGRECQMNRRGRKISALREAIKANVQIGDLKFTIDEFLECIYFFNDNSIILSILMVIFNGGI